MIKTRMILFFVMSLHSDLTAQVAVVGEEGPRVDSSVLVLAFFLIFTHFESILSTPLW